MFCPLVPLQGEKLQEAAALQGQLPCKLCAWQITTHQTESCAIVAIAITLHKTYVNGLNVRTFTAQ